MTATLLKLCVWLGTKAHRVAFEISWADVLLENVSNECKQREQEVVCRCVSVSAVFVLLTDPATMFVEVCDKVSHQLVKPLLTSDTSSLPTCCFNNGFVLVPSNFTSNKSADYL